MFPEQSAKTLAATPAASAVLSLLLTEGPLSRVEMARRLDLSSAAVTKAARPFLDAGYLHELASERIAPGAGRPVSPLAVTAEREYFVGVKVTTDDLVDEMVGEIVGVLCDLQAQVRVSVRRPLPDRSPEAVVVELAALVDELLDSGPDYRARTRNLGVAISGDVDRVRGLVRWSARLGWQDVPIGRLAAEATGLGVTVENDVKALTVAEHWFGEGVGTDSFALVTVGSGIGCGIVVDGRLLTGAYGVAGEIGHICVDPDGTRCRCGRQGCAETVATTGAILAAARTASGESDMDFGRAVERARAGDEPVKEVFAKAGTAIGLVVAAMVNICGPERIVVSGEGLDTYDLLEERIWASFAAHAFGAAARAPVLVRPLPFEEWARGAAAVSIQALFPQVRTTARAR
ncbi:ROK family transcriptional regulator [Streptomyces sp. NPDC006544]|uniref:ROK family transcriptional regulator n=1 Tax=Streptomyces sp. NPDC006544 TaxID=3154583 RepID=UPI0033A00834